MREATHCSEKPRHCKEGSPRSPKLEKACALQWRHSQMKKESVKHTNAFWPDLFTLSPSSGRRNLIRLDKHHWVLSRMDAHAVAHSPTALPTLGTTQLADLAGLTGSRLCVDQWCLMLLVFSSDHCFLRSFIIFTGIFIFFLICLRSLSSV